MVMYLTNVETCALNKVRVPSASLYCIWTSHDHPSAAAWKGLLCELLRGFFASAFARSFGSCEVTEQLRARAVITKCKLFGQV